MNEISLETLKLYQMYLKREKANVKYDHSKSWSENLAEAVLIGLTLDRVNYSVEVKEDRY